MLEIVTINDFFLGRLYEANPVQILENYYLYLIQSSMKEINIITCNYVSLIFFGIHILLLNTIIFILVLLVPQK